MTYKETRKQKLKTNKTRCLKNKKKRTYKQRDYYSGDGMLTTIWGPAMWHTLHTISFNYPVKPSCDDKKNYRNLGKGKNFHKKTSSKVWSE